jgi:CheY-like chemotaxis protein
VLSTLGAAPPFSLLLCNLLSSDLEILSNALSEFGYQIIAASDGASALREFNANRGAIDLLVTDIAMAPMNGCELAAKLLKARLDLRVVRVWLRWYRGVWI